MKTFGTVVCLLAVAGRGSATVGRRAQTSPHLKYMLATNFRRLLARW
jgi:hypothetical protein